LIIDPYAVTKRPEPFSRGSLHYSYQFSELFKQWYLKMVWKNCRVKLCEGRGLNPVRELRCSDAISSLSPFSPPLPSLPYSGALGEIRNPFPDSNPGLQVETTICALRGFELRCYRGGACAAKHWILPPNQPCPQSCYAEYVLEIPPLLEENKKCLVIFSRTFLKLFPTMPFK